MVYNDLCGCDKTAIARENNTQQPNNNMQSPIENIVIPEDNTQCPNERWSNQNNTNRPSDKWPNWNNNNNNANRPNDKWPNWDNNCPDNNNNCPENDMKCPGNNSAQKELLNKIRETVFALVDLNLFLDTHPNCKQALELFTSLAFTLEALKREYTSQYGPLKAMDVANDTPFEWVSDKYLWPWQRKKEE